MKSDLLASDKSLKILLRIRIRIRLSDADENPYKMSRIRNTAINILYKYMKKARKKI